MLQLKFLGGVSVPLSGPAAQRHRIALLALLATTRSRGMTRDKLVGYLWPETVEERARHLLSDAIYRLNRAAGVDLTATSGDTVKLNIGHAISDVATLESAFESSDFDGVAAAYSGPFLDGFFLPNSEAFEQWVSSERERFRRLYIVALDQLAERALSAHDNATARGHLRAILATDPYNSRVSLKLAQTLAAAGERGAALRHASEHEDQLRADLGLDLPADYRDVINRMKTGESTAGIAVLPFVEDVNVPGDQYLGDGITEELITALSRLDGIRVVARSTVFSLRGTHRDVREVGRLLNVAWVVEGTIRRASGQVRVSVQLVDAVEGFERWSATYARPDSDVFAVQEEIIRSIADQLESVMPREVSAPSPQIVTPEAYNLYLRGRHLWHRRGKDEMTDAIAYFEQAVSRAPRYARAWAGLADACSIAGWYDYVRPHETFPRALAAAQRALEIDPNLPAAHVALAYVAMYYDWDLPRAEEQFRRTIALAPEYPPVYQYYGNLLTAAGRFREAEDAMNRAQELDPLSLIASAAHGWTLYFARRYEAADEALRQTLERDPTFHPAQLWHSLPLEQLGRLDEMIDALERAVELSGSTTNQAALARGYALAGQAMRARKILDALEKAPDYVSGYSVAKAELALGNTDRAKTELERARQEREHSLILLNVDPQLDALRAQLRP